jgi:small subunit ribosomal protein S9
MSPESVLLGTGRRKTSVARVRVLPGSGRIEVNGRDFKAYFPHMSQWKIVLGPLEALQATTKYDVVASVVGGGPVGQAGAVRLGIARALRQPETEGALRDGGFLTRDSRMKERKKYGQRGARRRFQFSKR